MKNKHYILYLCTLSEQQKNLPENPVTIFTSLSRLQHPFQMLVISNLKTQDVWSLRTPQLSAPTLSVVSIWSALIDPSRN